MKPLIALIGRPNVGKSTLFNRIVGRREAIVDDFPGVTRDRHYADAEHCDRAFVVVDTGGFDPEAGEGMLGLMKTQVELALAEADALVLVMDAREGLTPTDEAIWDLVRRSNHKVYVAVNKVDNPAVEPLVGDFWRLGLDEIYSMTAERGSGVAELLDRIIEDLDCPRVEDAGGVDDTGPVRIAVVGRPNVGKSTFSNALLGQDRYLTSDVPGTTRDAIDTPFEADGKQYVLVDTAGIRRPKRVAPGVERMSVARSIQAMERSHVVALVIDASEGVTDQDKKLASLVVERGRAMVVVANKWDLAAGPGKVEEFKRHLKEELQFASFAPSLFTAAINGKNVQKFLPIADRVHGNLFKRIPTSELNRFYEEVVQTHPPHGSGTRMPRIRYLTQPQVDPPTILLFTGKVQVQANYLRFLQNQLRARYDFEGVPVRLIQK